MANLKVRTRNAPSPTGIPHIGNSRTALFDYLLAKKYNGKFILRIEDTDSKRFVPGATEKIYEIHDKLGLIPDESPIVGGLFGPYIQTQRLELYQKHAAELVEKGFAYKDDGAVRIKIPDTGYTSWSDLIQGKISIPNSEVDDKVLLKSDGIPTYHLAVVVDDHYMQISHVLRGVEWISSTPVHLLLYQALNWQTPIFAHVPLLLGPDKSKLAKRHGAKSALQYIDEGYLPEAIDNFMLYLGFSYQDNSAILSLKEMIKIFDENKIQKQNAVFDITKLDYFNSRWIKRLSDTDLFERLLPFIPSQWPKDSLPAILSLAKDRLVRLSDISTLADFFFIRPGKVDLSETELQYIKVAREVLENVTWSKEAIESGLVSAVKNNGWKNSDFFMALRLAVTGKKITPPLTESMLIIGREEILSRL